MKKYQIIYADPPWQWTKSSLVNRGKARAVEKEYSTMSPEQIMALPVKELAETNSVLFLWATYPKLDIALKVIEAWGFDYKTCGFVWVKQNMNNLGIFKGMGFYTRANAEPCLVATKGNGLHRQDCGVGQILISPRLKHSQKPEEVRGRITRLYGDLPRIELFARQKVAGWDCWGNEVDSDIELAVSHG